MAGTIDGLPDWPIIRHLTWREAHLFEIGLYFGLGAAIAFRSREYGAAVAAFGFVRRYIQSDDQREDTADLLRGFIRDAWYMTMGFAFAFLGGLVVVSAYV